jgi:hypothetical protein
MSPLFRKRKLRALYGDWSEFLASCSVEMFDTHFVDWQREHRELKAKKVPSTVTIAGHSPPPVRRYSTTELHDAESDASSIASQLFPLVHSKSAKSSSGKHKNDKVCVYIYDDVNQIKEED